MAAILSFTARDQHGELWQVKYALLPDESREEGRGTKISRWIQCYTLDDGRLLRKGEEGAYETLQGRLRLKSPHFR